MQQTSDNSNPKPYLISFVLIDELHVCPYCMSELRRFACCGEAGHGETAYLVKETWSNGKVYDEVLTEDEYYNLKDQYEVE